MTAIRLSLGSLYNALPRMKTVRIYFSSEFTFPNTYFKANFLRVLFETPEMRFTLLCNTNVHNSVPSFSFPCMSFAFSQGVLTCTGQFFFACLWFYNLCPGFKSLPAEMLRQLVFTEHLLCACLQEQHKIQLLLWRDAQSCWSLIICKNEIMRKHCCLIRSNTPPVDWLCFLLSSHWNEKW